MNAELETRFVTLIQALSTALQGFVNETRNPLQSSMRPTAPKTFVQMLSDQDKTKAKILETLLLAHKPLANRDIRDATGMTRDELSKPLHELIKEKAIWKIGDRASTVYAPRLPEAKTG